MSNSVIRRDKAIKYFRLVKFMANMFSKDPSTKVGALFLKPKSLEILTLGYNGMPRGINERDATRWERPKKYELTEHAERNAIYNSARNGVSLLGSICVVTMFPCHDCARGIINSGASAVVCENYNENENHERWRNSWNTSMEMFVEAGIDVILLSQDEIKIKDEEFDTILYELL